MLKALQTELLTLAADIASTRGPAFHSRLVDQTEPAALSERLIGIVKEERARPECPFMTMTSGAGHDAQIVSSLA